MRTIFKLAIPIIILFLASCKGSTDRDWSVINESSTDVEVWAVLIFGTDTIYQYVEKGDSKILTITTEDWGNSEPQQPYDVFKEFVIINADSAISKKDWTDIHDWDVFIEQTKRTPPQYMQTYDMVVMDKDF
jgi:hypothetical protein